MNVTLHPRPVFRFLLFTIGFLVLANIAGLVSKFYFSHRHVFGLVRLFDLNQEQNVPSLYSTLALGFAGMILWYISGIHRRQGTSYLPWRTLSIIFMFLAADEACSFHELLIGPVRNALDLSGIWYYSWIVPYGIVTIALGVGYLRFLGRLPRRTAVLFVSAGVIFISGAIGFEMLGGREFALYGYEDLTYAVYYTCEESLEMLGIALFIYAQLAYLAEHFGESSITIAVDERDKSAEGERDWFSEIMSRAKDGDLASCERLLGRVLPPAKAAEAAVVLTSLAGTRTEQGQAVVGEMAAGTLSAPEAATLPGVLEGREGRESR